MNYQEIAQENLILKIRSGSHLFGTSTPESDLDMVGVFLPTPKMLYGFANCEVVEMNIKDKDATGRNTADAVDCTFYEFRKFIKLATQNNPNILHLLFANPENIIFQSDLGKALLSKVHLFPSKAAHHRFVAYADAQRHKMRIKPENYHALEDALVFLADKDDHSVLGEYKNDSYCLKFDGEKGHHILIGDLHLEPSVYVKKARRMIEDRLSKATSRKELFLKYGFDCYSEETEFLTPSGWKKYDDVLDTDLLGTVNQTTGLLEFQQPYERVKKPYTGIMYQFNGLYTRFCVTPNHRLWVTPVYRGNTCSSKYIEEKAQWSIIPLQKILDEHRSWYHIRSAAPTAEKEGLNISNTFLKLIGAFASEGSVAFLNNGVKCIRICQTNKGKPEFFTMMEEVEKEFLFTSHSYKREDKNLVETTWILHHNKKDIVNNLVSLCVTQDTEKKLPDWYIYLTQEQANILLDSLFLGDGTQKNKFTRVYYTSSKILADQVQILAFLAGKEVNLIDGGVTTNGTQMYQVSYRTADPVPRAMGLNPNMKKHKRRETDKEDHRGGNKINYSGNIVCFSVPNEILVTRLGGKIAIQGNTKFASNLIHLLKEGIDLMKYGELVYPLPYAPEIVNVKQGKYTIEEILSWADELVEEARRAFEQTTLPEKPNLEEIEKFMIYTLRSEV